MNQAIQNTVQQYVNLLLNRIAGQYSIKEEELQELARETFRTRLTRAQIGATRGGRRAGSGGNSAYIVFCMQMRPRIKEENPNLTFGDVARILGERWRALSDEDRATFKTTTVVATPPPVLESDAPPKDMEMKQQPQSTSSMEPERENLETRLTAEIGELKLPELRILCENYRLPTSTKRKEMIRSIVRHRMGMI